MGIETAYIAGLFDGEGSVILARHRKGTKYLALVVQIVNTNRDVLEEIKLTYGGAIYAGRGTNKPIYAWKAYTDAAEKFLTAIEPYVHVKHRQVEIGLEFRRLIRLKGSQKRMTNEHVASREALKAELTVLNFYRGRKREL